MKWVTVQEVTLKSLSNPQFHGGFENSILCSQITFLSINFFTLRLNVLFLTYI